MVTVTEMEKAARGYQMCDEKLRVLFRHAEVEMPINHPRGDAKQAFGSES